jgi:hypothetical protein
MIDGYVDRSLYAGGTAATDSFSEHNSRTGSRLGSALSAHSGACGTRDYDVPPRGASVSDQDPCAPGNANGTGPAGAAVPHLGASSKDILAAPTGSVVSLPPSLLAATARGSVVQVPGEEPVPVTNTAFAELYATPHKYRHGRTALLYWLQDIILPALVLAFGVLASACTLATTDRSAFGGGNK